MTRINTNVASLTAQASLTTANNALNTTLLRLSTGLRINSAADNPAGFIAANQLGNNIAESNQAIANSQVANQVISTADSALSQVNTLLTTVQGLINQAANTGAESSSQIAANQLQIDSSLEAINSISQTTSFQGQNLLDGSLGFNTEGSTNFSAVQNLQVNQANFGTSSTVPVTIHVSALAQQAVLNATVNDGVTSDVKATAAITFNDGASLTIQAPSTGTSSNGIRVKFNESSTIGAGNASAAFDATTQTLNITVANSGTTSATAIANAITSDTNFAVTAHSSGATGFVAGTDNATAATDTISTANAGSLTLTSLIPGANTGTVHFVEGNASAGPTVSVDSSNNLTITVNSASYGGGVTSLSSIASAINAYTDSQGRQVYQANVNVAGSVNTTPNATTGLAPDGASVGAAVNSSTAVTVAGTTITLGAIGGAATGARIVFQKEATGTSSAVYDSTANNGSGQLTVTLSQTGGTGGGGGTGIYTASDLVSLINGATASHGANPFQTLTTGNISGAPLNISATATNSTTVVSAVDGTNSITFTGAGATANGDTISIESATSGSSSATFSNGTLNVVLLQGGGSGSGGSYTTSDLQTLINGAAGSPFTVASTSGNIDATQISTSVPVTATASGGIAANPNALTAATVATVTTGSNGAVNALNGTFSGGGIGAQFGVGTGATAGTGTSGLAASLTLQVVGSAGSQLLSFAAGATASQIASAINQISDSTGVAASTEGDDLKFNSTNYGSAAFVDVQVVNEGTGGTFSSSLSGTHANGTDIQATVNDSVASGSGNTVSVDSPNLAFSAALDPTQLAVGENIQFNITGGGATFQLGPSVESAEQARLGIQGVGTASLGGSDGYLYQLASGNNASLTSNTALASKIVTEAIDAIDSLRGRLGAFQSATVDTNIATLTNTVTNLTAAQSDIQDADFASESSNLTRDQILVQSGTTVLGIANKNPENILSLLH
jgi:flagellin